MFRLDDGLDLMVSHNPKTMQSVAFLLLAVKRMKKSLSDCGERLSDEQLCYQILDSLVEGESQRKPNHATSLGSNRRPPLLRNRRPDGGELHHGGSENVPAHRQFPAVHSV